VPGSVQLCDSPTTGVLDRFMPGALSARVCVYSGIPNSIGDASLFGSQFPVVVAKQLMFGSVASQVSFGVSSRDRTAEADRSEIGSSNPAGAGSDRRVACDRVRWPGRRAVRDWHRGTRIWPRSRLGPGQHRVASPGLAVPRTVRYASYLMWAGAALQAVAAVTALLTDGLMRATFFGIFSLFAIVFLAVDGAGGGAG